jgi:hypothetical protein
VALAAGPTAGAALVWLVACGGGVVKPAAAPSPTFPANTVPVHGYVRGDQDEDADMYVPDRDDAAIRDYGHAASASDRRAAITLVRRYYRAAAAGDVATVCALTDRALADGGRLIDTVSEDYAPPPGRPSLRGKGCPAVVAAVTRERRDELAGDIETLVLTEMRVRSRHALAIIGLRTSGERVVELQREGGRWKVDALFDSGVT